jgi:hypothetical protein
VPACLENKQKVNKRKQITNESMPSSRMSPCLHGNNKKKINFLKPKKYLLVEQCPRLLCPRACVCGEGEGRGAVDVGREMGRGGGRWVWVERRGGEGGGGCGCGGVS